MANNTADAREDARQNETLPELMVGNHTAEPPRRATERQLARIDGRQQQNETLPEPMAGYHTAEPRRSDTER